jgi:translation initiation factor IF-2
VPKASKKKTTETIKTASRPPIVTIMGHVDHGKTSLLDYIRKSHVQAKEAGGITQHIGAYQVVFRDSLITFIDTPGHAAFNKMRSQGAKVTDIVVLVIAATESVKPQTVESLNHIKNAGVPFIVALNKMDLPTADPLLVKSELAKYDCLVEEFGGQTPVVEVSAKTGKGVPELLEMIQLMYELNPSPLVEDGVIEAVIIESSMNKHKGPIATVLVKQGTLTAGQSVYLGKENVKIRSLIDSLGKNTKVAPPGAPVEMAGFKTVPPVGATLRSTAEEPAEVVIEEKTVVEKTDTSLSRYEEDLKNLLEEKEVEKPPSINVILKADVQGTLQAIRANLPDEVIVVDASVGEVTDSDILMASSTKSTLIAFNTKVSPSSISLAQSEGIKVKSYTVIYKLLEDIEKIILKLLEPTIDEEVLGTAEIIKVFDMKGDRIAGCKVSMGEIKKTDLVHLMRNEKIVTDVKVKSLKLEKTDVDKVKVGSECGIIIQPQHSFQIGDQIMAYKMKSEE